VAVEVEVAMAAASHSGRGGNDNGNVRGDGRNSPNGRGSMIIPGSLQEHGTSVSAFKFTSSTAGNELQPGSTATVSTTTTTTTKLKRTKPEDANIASMITVEDIQNSEHRLCGFLDPLCVHLQHKGMLPGNYSQKCVVCGKNCHAMWNL
jgi:hypothetical protein